MTFFRAGSKDNSRRYSASCVVFQNNDYLSNHGLRDVICDCIPEFLGYHLLLFLTAFGSKISHCNSSRVRTHHFVWRALKKLVTLALLSLKQLLYFFLRAS